MLPDVIVVDGDYGAEWPIWTEGGSYVPLDDVPLPENLRERLLQWQQQWEELAWPPWRHGKTEAARLRRFLDEGERLTAHLSNALPGVEVRFGFTRG